MSEPQRTQQRANANELLSTKLTPPRLHSAVVLRERLLTRLDEGLDRKLTLLSASPGFGKTTLVSEWLAARTEPEAWVSLDESDDDPIRFWRYVITACRAFEPGLGRSTLVALRASQPSPLEAALTPFINEVAQLPQRCILVLDDYHVITSRQVHDTLAFLLEHFPTTLHLVLVTRSEPPLPLARLRARGELNELNAADLRFSLDEIRAFCEHTLRLPLSTEALTRLEARTEGWAVGLRLASLALEGQTDASAAEEFLTTLTGGHRHILDYLAGEVLARQPESLQEFLLQTSLLDRLTASLCDAVTGRSDSASLLDRLARANLFLFPVGHEGDQMGYRYHTLFAEAMSHVAQQRLGESDVLALRDKAAQWYAAHGFLERAVEASIAARAFERAADLIERIVEQRGLQEVHTLRRWIEQLPKGVLDAHPVLNFNHAMAILFTSNRFAPATAASVEIPLQAAEQAWRAAQDDHGLGRVFALRSIVAFWQGDHDRTFAYARQAFGLLPEHEINWRGISLCNIGMEEVLTGHIDSAQGTLLEARALCVAAQNTYAAMAATLSLGEVYLQRMELDQAAQLYQQVLLEVGDLESMKDDRSQAELGLGLVAFERDDPVSAEAHASRAIEIAQHYPDESLHQRASLILAWAQHARGQTAHAQEILHALAARTKRTLLLREIHTWQARFSLATGDTTAVQGWYATGAQYTDGVPSLQQEQEALMMARWHIANRRPDQALELLEHWRVDAHDYGRVRSELEIMCLKALAYFDQADLEGARKTLIRALTLAQPRDCPRIFLDEGEKMIALLQAVLPDLGKRPLVRYATLLLRSFASTRSPSSASAFPASSPLLEPLSPQEQRVLRLLAAGLSNADIARELVVSTNTIKTQVKSIYSKLNVNNRDDAREMARQLNLL